VYELEIKGFDFFPCFGDRNLRAILQIYPKYSQKFCGEIGMKNVFYDV
jgi:hypothetical protein